MRHTMTEQELQQLSRGVAEKYSIEAYILAYAIDSYENRVWLHQDSGRCLDLAVEHAVELGISHDQMSCSAWSIFSPDTNQYIKVENYHKHNDDKPQATRVSILKVLMAKDKKDYI